MRVVFMGTPEFSVPILQGLIDNYEVVLVVSQPDRKVGRKREVVYSPIKKLALDNNIEVFQPESIRFDYEKIFEHKPDIIITCAYGQFIPKEVLDFPEYGCINVHGSILPKLRGGAPIHWAIINGFETTGMTVMYMDPKMDAGDIISTREIDILDTDDTGTMHEKLSVLGRDLLLDTLPSIFNKTNERIKQDEKLVTYGLNITKEDEFVNFDDTSKNVINKIRGLSPFPGSYSLLDNERIKFYKAEKFKDSTNYLPGEIVDVTKNGFVVSTKDALILITDLQLFGKRRMLVSEMINGINKDDFIGKVLGK